MLPALLTTFLFSFSVLFASRSARLVGSMQANVSRLTLAMLLLGLWAHGWGGGFKGAGLPWFLLSGFIGFGLGDIALFGALPRIGPRLAILLTQCLAAPIAGVTEYFLLGTRPTVPEMACGALILSGVGLALAPDAPEPSDKHTTSGSFKIGVLFGIGSALGQALGAVCSRRGNAAALLAGTSIDGGTAAYQRITAGVLTTLVFWAGLILLRRSREQRHSAGVWKEATPFVVGNALSGPTLGVACFQWALITTPSAKVLPIVATSPLVTMAMVWMMEGKRPSTRAMFGGLVAVSGAAALAWMQAHPR